MKNNNIQHLRGLACVMLVLYHVVGADPGRGLQLDGGPLRLLSDALAAVRMPLFALLAGAVYGLRPRSGINALFDKAHRLLLPVLTVGTLFAVVQAMVPGTRDHVVDWHLLHIVPVGHYWFLQSLFLIFVLMSLAEKIGLADTPVGHACLFAASVVLYLSHPSFIWLGVAGMAYLLPFFLVGVALTRHGLSLPSPRLPFAMAMVSASLVVMALWQSPAPDADRFSPAMLALGLMLSLALWACPPRMAWLARTGDKSYVIFLFHAFFTAGTRIALQAMGIESLTLHLVCATLAGLYGPVLVERVLRDWPMGRSLLLGEPRRNASPVPPPHVVPPTALPTAGV